MKVCTWNKRNKRWLQQRWGEEGGWETGAGKELLAKAHTLRGGDTTDKVRPALSSGLSWALECPLWGGSEITWPPSWEGGGLRTGRACSVGFGGLSTKGKWPWMMSHPRYASWKAGGQRHCEIARGEAVRKSFVPSRSKEGFYYYGCNNKNNCHVMSTRRVRLCARHFYALPPVFMIIRRRFFFFYFLSYSEDEE